MKAYSTPMIMIEEFTVNHTVADCGDTSTNISLQDFDCLTGSVKDNGTAFSSSCNRPCAVFSGYKKAAKLGAGDRVTKSVTFANVTGIIAYCTQGMSKSMKYVSNSEWYASGDTVYHPNTHPQSGQYHCMVRGVTETEIDKSLS